MSTPDAGQGPVAPADGVPAEPAAQRQHGAWWRLGRALRPRSTVGQLITALLLGILGFAVVVQLRQVDEPDLSTLRQSELVSLLDDTTAQADALDDQVRDLEQTKAQLESGSNTRAAAREALLKEAADLGILTGRLPAEGPGITVDIADPDGTVKASTLLNLLEELRNAGAEAIQLNSTRVVATTYLTDSRSGVVVDGVTIPPPYHWRAVGPADTLATALDIPGGALDAIRQDGGKGTVERLKSVSIDATVVAADPRWAQVTTSDG